MDYKAILIASALTVLCLPSAGHAQSSDIPARGKKSERTQHGASSPERMVRIAPYIEIAQFDVAELSPGNDVVTYTQVAAGVDASVTGRNNGGSLSVRYERNFGYGNKTRDAGTLSGIARGYATIVPQALTLEAGALASRTTVNDQGTASQSLLRASSSESRVYSAYAGPNLHTSAGDVQINANYRLGYSRLEAPIATISSTSSPVDYFADSWVQTAAVHVATRPGEPLPFGLGLGGGITQEDISNFDQRLRDVHVRADVTVPLTYSLAGVGGIGYEDVKISGRDALFDAVGNPVIGSDGRIVTDTSAPRRIAYDVTGLIWDVGAVWRPSTRTSLEAHVGRRYDSTNYYGTFAWAPTSRTSVNVAVYDSISGFGSQLTDALGNLPTEFTATRNALTGDLGGCVASAQGGNCLSGVLGSIRSSTFRARGLAASYSASVGRTRAGVGFGYDRRTFIGAPGTFLAAANGVVDENYWASFYLSGDLGRNAGYTANAYANYLKSGFSTSGDILAVGASAAYRQQLTAGLSARMAIALDRYDSTRATEDLTTASALVGLRYDF